MLTDVEYRYLRRNTRRFKMTPDEATAALGAAGVPLLPVFLAFQTAFGGYCPDDDVTYGIVGPDDNNEGEPRVRKQGRLQLVRCDLKNRTQIRLYLDQNGVFYQEDTPVAESFESYLVFAAYVAQTLQPLGWTYIDQERRATKRFRALSEKWEPAPVVPHATDPHHAVHQGPQYFELTLGDDRQLYVRPDLLKG